MFGDSAAASSPAGDAQAEVAARTNPISAATQSLQFRIMRFPPKPCFFESAEFSAGLRPLSRSACDRG